MEYPEGLALQHGSCAYCGQMMSFHTDGSWGQEQLNELATLGCSCPHAKRYQALHKAKDAAERKIRKLFGRGADMKDAEDAEDETVSMLIKLVGLIADEQIQSASIVIAPRLKAKMSVSSKGTIKVKRTIMQERTEEME